MSSKDERSTWIWQEGRFGMVRVAWLVKGRVTELLSSQNMGKHTNYVDICAVQVLAKREQGPS